MKRIIKNLHTWKKTLLFILKVSSVATPGKELSQSGIDPVVDITDNTAHPGDNIIKNILNFSKALTIIPSGKKSQIGTIEIVSN